MTIGLHRIEWTLEPECITSRVICEATPSTLGASCKLVCPQGCEDSCDHPKDYYPGCNIVDWLEADNPLDLYDGEPTKPRDGYIVPVWNGDCFVWHYDDSVAANFSVGGVTQ